MIGENRIASLGRRTWAALIDSLVVSVFVLILYYDPLMVLSDLLARATTQEAMEVFKQAFQGFQRQNFPYIFSLYVLYHTLLIWQSGMTPGKYLMRIRVVDQVSGGRLSFGMAFLRALVRTVGEIFLLYLTFLPAFFSPWHQTLHDRVSRALVVNIEADV